jgi:Flp pilus assembly protein CpaB
MTLGPGGDGQPVTPEPVRRWLRDVMRTAQWHRRVLAAALLAAAMAVGLNVLAPPAADTEPVLAAARDLAPGRPLTPDDVEVVQRPADQLPTGALVSVAEAAGSTLLTGMRAGELLIDVRLAGEAAVGSLPDGQVATPVRIADPTAVRLLSPGDVIDVLAAGAPDGPGGDARLVASAVRVMTVPRPAEDAWGANLGDGALVLLATTPSTAARLAGAAVTDRLSFVLRRG